MPTSRTYQVPAVHCGHCKASIESSVGALEDVESVNVDLDTRKVAVVGDASDESIRAAIDEAGYEVAGVS
ncbi:MAG: heavy-metal-associated domain-containing protein [Nitriliruptorales bacterium]